MNLTLIQNNFISGEVSPLLEGRIDSPRYQTGLKLCQNFLPTRQGGIRKRPGTIAAGTTKSNAKARLIEMTIADDYYIIELTNLKARIWKSDYTIVGGGTPTEITTPWAAADLASLKYAIEDGTVWIAHHSYAVRTLALVGSTWTLSTPTFTGDRTFASAGKYPRVIFFVGGRLGLAGTDDEPTAVFLSKTPLASTGATRYTDFDFDTGDDGTIAPDDAIYLLESDITPILWAIGAQRVFMGTNRTVWMDTGNGITPADFDMSVLSYTGASEPQAVMSETITLYVGRGGRSLHALIYDSDSQAYQDIDLSRDFEHFLSSPIVDMKIQNFPEPVLWMVREDGLLISCSIDMQSGMIAWARHPMSGTVESIAVGYGASEDVLWMTVLRGTTRTVEYLRFQDLNKTPQEDFHYVDSGLVLYPSYVPKDASPIEPEIDGCIAQYDASTLSPYPDDPAGTTYIQDAWATVDGWTGSRATLSVSSGILVYTATASNSDAYKSFTFTAGKTIRLRVRSTLGVVTQLALRQAGTILKTWDISGTDWNILDFTITPAFAGENMTLLCNNSVTSGIVLEVDFIYIGTGKYLDGSLQNQISDSYDGTIYGCTPDGAGGLIFDGVNDYVKLYSMVLPSSWTLPFVVNPTALDLNKELYSKAAPSGQTYESLRLYIGSTGNLYSFSADTLTTRAAVELAPAGSFSVGVEKKLYLVKSGTSISTYINGALVRTTSITLFDNGASYLYLCSRTGGSNYFGGTVSGLRWFNRALTASEVYNQIFGVVPLSGSTVSGLDHLNGQTVIALGDGSILPPKLVASGQVFYPGVEIKKIHIGLVIESEAQTLRPETPANGTSQGKNKRIENATARLYRSLGGEIGALSGNTVKLLTWKSGTYIWGSAPELYTGDLEANIAAALDKDARLDIVHTDPAPFFLLAIIYRVAVMEV